MLLPFVPPPPLEAREARGRNQRRRGANLHRGICSRSPTARGGGAPRGWGYGERRKRAPGSEAGNPAQDRAGAGPGLAGRGERRGSKAGGLACWRVGVVLPWPRAEGRDVARAAGGGAGHCQAAGAGRWRYLDAGPWNLALFQQNVNTSSPSTHSLGIKPFGSVALRPNQWPGSAHATTPTLALLLGMPFLSGKIQCPPRPGRLLLCLSSSVFPWLEILCPSIFQ